MTVKLSTLSKVSGRTILRMHMKISSLENYFLFPY